MSGRDVREDQHGTATGYAYGCRCKSANSPSRAASGSLARLVPVASLRFTSGATHDRPRRLDPRPWRHLALDRSRVPRGGVMRTDRRTGPCHRCQTRTWSVDRVCRACRGAERREAHRDVALTDGEWRPRGLIQVWVRG